MAVLSVNLIPLEIDVWNVLENELKTGLKDILSVTFQYSAHEKRTDIEIIYLLQGDKCKKDLYLPNDDLVIRLCNTFNIPTSHLNYLQFGLIPGEVPNFTVKLWPFVSDESALDKIKSRMNVKTID